MNFKIFGKQVNVGEIFSKYSEETLLKSVQKYFPNPVSSIVPIEKETKFYPVRLEHQNYYKKNTYRYEYYRFMCGRDSKLKLGNISALMFRNKKHSGLNMIYKREDGLIGWVDPRGNRNSATI